MILLDELQGLDLLRDMSPPHQQRLAALARLTEHAPGAVLFREGDDHSWVHFVLEGEVDLETEPAPGETTRLQTLGPGELLGWSPVLRDGPMTVTARTRTGCRLASLVGHQLQQVCDEDPRFGMEFLRRVGLAVAQRLAATRRKLVECRQGVRPE